ncbi:ornithine cyclodeaminase family protein [Liquorilactobacillus mali]|uniref:Alanine dehydrogenase n=1 Tax=Liquorilactobacillus mali TaxID=1618 RepID=A0A0R2FV83_9LACO|nr:ornithine cyclodeaminase family protein [Liquorilactobacillus mali]KRN32152.1 alanine dehydrogenase [Liquorilactobacillus mali]
MKKGSILFINEKEAKTLITAEEAIKLSEQAFADFSDKKVINPVKLHTPLYPYHDGYTNCMPAFSATQDIAGVKVISVYKNNIKKHDLPATIGTIVLNDPDSGCPLAIMDGTYVTSARTGATMAIFSKYLAKEASEVVTVIGTGAQGLSSVIMILKVLPQIKEVRAVDINPAARKHFIDEASKIYPHVDFVELEDLQSACTNSDIVVNAANSSVLLLPKIKFDKGTTVLVLEEDLKPSYVKKTFDAFVVDFIDCFVERSNISLNHRHDAYGEEVELVTAESISGEIGDVIAGKKSFRESDDDIIVASSIGMGIQDVMTADYIYKKALKKNVGKELEFLDL